ncbi:MAG: hypothetical protein ACTS5A_01395 [Candidatus Hodgkinia cicadicola]
MTGRSTFPRSAISEGGIIFTVAQSFQQIWTTFECEAFESLLLRLEKLSLVLRRTCTIQIQVPLSPFEGTWQLPIS